MQQMFGSFQSRVKTAKETADKFLREPKKARALNSPSYAFPCLGRTKFWAAAWPGFWASDTAVRAQTWAWHGAIKERSGGQRGRCPLADADPDPISPLSLSSWPHSLRSGDFLEM